MILNFNFLLSILFMLTGSSTTAEANLSKAVEFKQAKALYTTHITTLYDEMELEEYDLNPEVFEKAVTGFYNLKSKGELDETRDIITIIDYTKPSAEKRFYTIDLEKKEVLFHTYVAHGMRSGGEESTSFSNVVNSNQSSIGFIVTGETYHGIRGYSLRLDGKDAGYNSNVRGRAVVIHKSDKVNERWAKEYGMVGRTLGCPAVPTELNDTIINTIKGKTMLFNFYDDANYLTSTNNLDEFTAIKEFLRFSV